MTVFAFKGTLKDSKPGNMLSVSKAPYRFSVRGMKVRFSSKEVRHFKNVKQL